MMDGSRMGNHCYSLTSSQFLKLERTLRKWTKQAIAVVELHRTSIVNELE